MDLKVLIHGVQSHSVKSVRLWFEEGIVFINKRWTMNEQWTNNKQTMNKRWTNDEQTMNNR